MNAFNVCTFIGHVPSHPSFKPVYMAGDDQKKSRYSATLAVRRSIKKQGEQYYAEDLIRFTAWGSSADFINNYAPPGTTIAITGSLNVDTVEKDGNRITYHTIMVDNVRIVGSSSNSNEQSGQTEQKEETVAQPIAQVKNPFHRGQAANTVPTSPAQPAAQEQPVTRFNPFGDRSQ